MTPVPEVKWIMLRKDMQIFIQLVKIGTLPKLLK